MKRKSRKIGSRNGFARRVHIEGLESRRLLSGVQLGSFLFFADTDAQHGTELWRSDLDGSNKLLVADILPGTKSSNPQELTLFNNMIYFGATGATSGTELYRTDGTEAGTELFAELRTGSSGGNPDTLTVIGNLLYFVASDNEHGYELFRTDGSDDK